MCIVYKKRKIVLSTGAVATRIIMVGNVTMATGYAPEGEKKPTASSKQAVVDKPSPTTCRDGSSRRGLIPTGRRHRSLIRGSTSAGK